MYAHAHINTAITVFSSYTNREPFAAYLRHFFSKDKKYGSRDRKTISHLCYCLFRLGNALQQLPVKERMIKALFLCSTKNNQLLEELEPELNRLAELPINEKMKIAGDAMFWQQIFPLANQVSEKINFETFACAHLQQPGLFLRIRPGYETAVQQKAAVQTIPCTFIPPHTLQLPNGADAGGLFELNKEVVVQDYSSQQTGTLFQKYIPELHTGKKLNVLDACAASGGKTIMLYDILEGKGDFTVNDIRPSILHNLGKRFKEAGINGFRLKSADLTGENEFDSEHESFDVIIADVPCSGSGTWSRCPENLSFFTEEQLNRFPALQQNIIQHLVPLLRKGGLFFYITCSVYACENEQNTAFLQKHCGLKLLEEACFTGYERMADTMYAAVFANL